MVEELKIKEERPVKRLEIDQWVFDDNSKMPEQFLTINIQAFE